MNPRPRFSNQQLLAGIRARNNRDIARSISLVESGQEGNDLLAALDREPIEQALILGITGPPGAGKSTISNLLISWYRRQQVRLGIIAVDPSSPISGGALLGDRIRMMEHAADTDVVIRSMASRGRLGGLCGATGSTTRIMAAGGCRIIIIETVGVGQSEMDIIQLADVTILVMAPGLGDDIQAMKAGLLEVADLLVVNKADRQGAETLALDLEVLTREQQSGRDPRQVIKTNGLTGEGLSELSAAIECIDSQHRNSGERQRRRRQSTAFETIEYGLAGIRPHIARLASDEKFSAIQDPRQRAAAILKEILPAKT